jgi:crotonobetainyl-CoA:carnitine CoA-transferase CaiB-like acyl-CoA transferase
MNSLTKMGLDYEGIKKANESIIYAHFSGYGSKGEEAAKPGFDLSSYWARSGTMCDWVNDGDFPFRPPGGYGDAVASSALMNGVLAALFARQSSGKGTFLESSLLGSAIWFNQVGIVSAEPHHGNQYPKSKMRPVNPFSHLYQCRDGEWMIITVSVYATDYPICCRILGMEEYIDDERYNNLKGVAEHIEEFVAIINAKFREKNRDEWRRLFTAADIVNESLVHSRDVIQDQQAWANGYFRNVTYKGSGHVTTFPTAPVKFSEYPVEAFEIPGGVGRDSKEILLAHGYTEEEYRELLEKKAIK